MCLRVGRGIYVFHFFNFFEHRYRTCPHGSEVLHAGRDLKFAYFRRSSNVLIAVGLMSRVPSIMCTRVELSTTTTLMYFLLRSTRTASSDRGSI